jgi:hypothetical protein
VTAPERSHAQRISALSEANRIRVYRAQLKVNVAFGEIDARDVIREPEQEVETMKIYDLLLAMPVIGKSKANRLLQAVAISPSKTLGGLTDRQRDELLTLLGRVGQYSRRAA